MKKITARFIGAMCDIGPIALKYFGQRVELDEATFREAVRGNAAILPEADFNRIGFTAEELAKYRIVAARRDPSDSFAVKYSKACDRLREIREEINNPTPAKVEAEIPKPEKEAPKRD